MSRVHILTNKQDTSYILEVVDSAKLPNGNRTIKAVGKILKFPFESSINIGNQLIQYSTEVDFDIKMFFLTDKDLRTRNKDFYVEDLNVVYLKNIKTEPKIDIHLNYLKEQIKALLVDFFENETLVEFLE